MRTSGTAHLSPRLSAVLRALREAAGVSQEGWAAQLGYARRTIQHWVHGDLLPDADATESLIRLCQRRRLLREYREGVLAGCTVTAEWLGGVVAEARLARRISTTQLKLPVAEELAPRREPTPSDRALPLDLTHFIGREREIAKLRRLLYRQDARLLTLTGPG